MIKKILIHPNPYLRKVSTEVEEFSQEVKDAIKDLEDTLKANVTRAVGLSANQIGCSYRIISFFDLQNGDIISLVNPKITYFSKDDCKTQKEACMSFPGRSKKVSRAREIVVEGYSMSGVPLTYSMEDMQARIVQHEVDHLNGRCRISER